MSRCLRLELIYLFAVFFFLLSPPRIAIKLPAGSIFVFLRCKINEVVIVVVKLSIDLQTLGKVYKG